MAVHNPAIIAVFDEIADLLEIQNANPFRVRAYRNAARTIKDLAADVTVLAEQGTSSRDIPGIGEDLAKKIQEIVATGRCEFLERLHEELPASITELMRVPGLGPKRVGLLYHKLQIQSVEQLLAAAQEHRLRELPGFGEKTEQKIIEGARARVLRLRRIRLALAARQAEPLAAHLRAAQGVEAVEIAGSFRRMRETVGDLDIVVVAQHSGDVMDRFTAYRDVQEVLARGPTRSSVLLESGLQVDLRNVPRESFGAALVYFTGSKAHNIAIRRIALDRELKLNEYGVFREDVNIAGATEAAVYEAIGLPWIPPELREDRGEIEAARAGTLPKLIEPGDLRGDLHVRCASAGSGVTLREMALAAQTRGLGYIAIVDDARALDPAKLEEQSAEIDRLNRELPGFTVLKGIEAEIRDDGTLSVPDTVLARLDLVVAAVHSPLDLTRAEQTARVLRALDNRSVSILATPAGLASDERRAYDADMLEIAHAAKTKGIALEVSVHPDRVDLTDAYCQAARQAGALVAISSDAHAPGEMDQLRFAVGQARRGWLEKSEALNARGFDELKAWLAGRS
jgi:DNA polymerase (family X)